jgi:hypothetical protein
MTIYIDLIKDIYWYCVNRNKSVHDFVQQIFPKESWDAAKKFFDKYMTNKHKYMEIDCYNNSITTADEFFKRACFSFEPLYQDGYLCYDNCSLNDNYINLQEDQGVYFHGKDKCFLLSENFSCFVYEICQRDHGFRELIANWFPNLQLSILKKYNPVETEKLLIDFFKKNHECSDCVSFDFMTPDGLLITKESFFYRARFNLGFPPKPLIVKDIPKDVYWYIGHGLGDEDTGGTEGNIAIHSRTGEILYYEAPFPSPILTTKDFMKIASSLEELIELLEKHNVLINGVLVQYF